MGQRPLHMDSTQRFTQLQFILRRAAIRPLRAASLVGHLIEDWAIDFKGGIRTELNLDDALRSQATAYWILRDVKSHMERNKPVARTFIDIGCRGGRPLFYFAPFFDELIGYEVQEDVGRIASNNLRRWQGANPAYAKIRIETTDATRSLPLDRSMVLFMYNSLDRPHLKTLCERIASSDKPTYIYYVNPCYGDVLVANLPITRVDSIKNHTNFYLLNEPQAVIFADW